jgi:hypothetical protein
VRNAEGRAVARETLPPVWREVEVNVMAATRTVRQEFQWDRKSLRYRRNGKFVSERAVKLGVRRVIRASQAEMRAVTDEMIRGEITVGDWQARFAGELKNAHVSGAMAGQGGPANMTREDYLRVGRGLKLQYRYLDRFARQVRAGELTDDQTRRRAEMYVNSMNGAYEGGRRASAVAAGFDQERNVLGKREKHCTTKVRVGCTELTKRGWVQIESMPLPGSRNCLSGCGCSLKFRRRPNA